MGHAPPAGAGTLVVAPHRDRRRRLRRDRDLGPLDPHVRGDARRDQLHQAGAGDRPDRHAARPPRLLLRLLEPAVTADHCPRVRCAGHGGCVLRSPHAVGAGACEHRGADLSDRTLARPRTPGGQSGGRAQCRGALDAPGGRGHDRGRRLSGVRVGDARLPARDAAAQRPPRPAGAGGTRPCLLCQDAVRVPGSGPGGLGADPRPAHGLRAPGAVRPRRGSWWRASAGRSSPTGSCGRSRPSLWPGSSPSS